MVPAAALAQESKTPGRPSRAAVLEQALGYITDGRADLVADRHLTDLAILVVGTWTRRRRICLAQADNQERAAVRVFQRRRLA